MNNSLETALHYAGKAGDMESLKRIARSENHRYEKLQELFWMVLSQTGPIEIDLSKMPNTPMTLVCKTGDSKELMIVDVA